MKNIIKRLPKKLLAVVTSLVLIASLSSTAFANFGPTDASRPTRVWNVNENGFDHVTFDSYTGVPNGIGDEPDFFRGAILGNGGTFTDPVSNVNQDAEVEGHIYIHNNADPLLNTTTGTPGIAHNVTVSVNLPSTIAKSQELKADISADNAQPQTIFDTLDVTGANGAPFQLVLEPGSTQVHADDTNATTTLTADQEKQLFSTTGYNMGDQKGCFNFIREITFVMKVQMPQYNLQKQVRLPGQSASDWKESIDAKDGDTLEWSIKFSNIGKTELKNVAIVDEIPAGLTIVPGSITLYSSNFPNGTSDFSPNPIQANGRQLNIIAGNYLPLTQDELNAGDISTQIIFRTKVSTADLVCGANSVVNKAFSTPEGLGAISDTASANVNKECVTPPVTPPTTPTTPTTPATTVASVTPTALPNTGPGSVIGLFSGVTIGGALLHRLFLSRKLALRRGL